MNLEFSTALPTEAGDSRMTLPAGSENQNVGHHRMSAMLLGGRHDKHQSRPAQEQEPEKPRKVTGNYHIQFVTL
jgi:hypothetical protein